VASFFLVISVKHKPTRAELGFTDLRVPLIFTNIGVSVLRKTLKRS